jgi:hypothetical protein
MALARSFETQQTQVVLSADGAPTSPSARLPTSDGSNGAFTPQPKYPDRAFVVAVPPLVVVYLAAELAKELNGSAQPRRAQTEQLEKELLAQLRRVPGVTEAHYESIKSKLGEAVKGGATAFAGFVSWLKGELMGPTLGQRDQPPSSAQPVPATPLPPRAVSPAAAPAVDPAVAKTQRLFASTLNEAGSLNQRLVPQMQVSRDAWNSAQKQMAQFYWQAAGGQAATPRLQDVLGQLQGSIQALRKAHAQSNEPLAQLKSEQKTLQALQRESGGMGLAPQARGALGQVGKWAQSAEQWRTTLNERINALEKWAQAAQTAMQARAAAGAQGAAMPLALPPPPAGVAPSVVQAARAAKQALQEQQQQPARLPEPGSRSTTAEPSGPGVPGARVGYTGGVGTPEQVEQRRREQVAEELQRVERQIAESRRTQLPGGSPEVQAQREREFYNRSRLAQMGVTYNQLQNYLQKPQGPAGNDGAAVRAGMGAGSPGGGGSVSPPNGPVRPNNPSRDDLFDNAVEAGTLQQQKPGVYQVNPSLGLATPQFINDVGPVLEFVDTVIERDRGMPGLSPINVGSVIPIADTAFSNTREEWHDDQQGPLVVTDKTGKSYVVAGWSDFVEAKLRGESVVNAHHVQIPGTLELPSGTVVLDAVNGEQKVFKAQDRWQGPEHHQQMLRQAQQELSRALQTIDPRINLDDLPEYARQALTDLVRSLFTSLPGKTLEIARLVHRDGWQAALDVPEMRGFFAEWAIANMASRGTLDPTDMYARNAAFMEKAFGPGPTNSDWQPSSVSGDGTFSGFIEQLIHSKDPVVEQIRRGLVLFLTDTYVAQREAERIHNINRLNDAMGIDQRALSVPLDPRDTIEQLELLHRLGTREAMTKELREALDSYFDQRASRERAGDPPPQ